MKRNWINLRCRATSAHTWLCAVKEREQRMQQAFAKLMSIWFLRTWFTHFYVSFKHFPEHRCLCIVLCKAWQLLFHKFHKIGFGEERIMRVFLHLLVYSEPDFWSWVDKQWWVNLKLILALPFRCYFHHLYIKLCHPIKWQWLYRHVMSHIWINWTCQWITGYYRYSKSILVCQDFWGLQQYKVRKYKHEYWLKYWITRFQNKKYISA